MKQLVSILFFCFAIGLSTGCGTVFGGKISQCQQTKPLPGQAKRQIRPAAFIGDLCVAPLFLAIDFATGGIYKPCDSTSNSINNAVKKN